VYKIELENFKCYRKKYAMSINQQGIIIIIISFLYLP
jgi:hypothetical protein